MRTQKRGRPLSAGLLLLLILFFASHPATAQMRHSAGVSDQYQHIFMICPLGGSGTMDDPKRPMFVPAQGLRPVVAKEGTPLAPRSGIVSVRSEISDDGAHALVEFTGVSLADFKEILSTSDSRVQLFRKGVDSKDRIEAAFRVYKKDFSLDRFLGLGAR
jgi:hypothetical protein